MYPEGSSISTTSSIRTLEASSAPTTPTEETTSQRLSRASWAFRSGNRSRPTSSSGENRKGSTFARLVRSVEKAPSKDVIHSAHSLHPHNNNVNEVVTDIGQITTPDSDIPTRAQGKLQQNQTKMRLKSKERKGDLSSGEADHLSRDRRFHKEIPDRQCIAM